MQAIITADELAHDLPGAEAMMVRYKEHNAEVESRQEAFDKFRHTGRSFIANGHFLSKEVSQRQRRASFCLFGVFLLFVCDKLHNVVLVCEYAYAPLFHTQEIQYVQVIRSF